MYTPLTKVLHHLEGGKMAQEISKAIVVRIDCVLNGKWERVGSETTTNQNFHLFRALFLK